LRLYILKEPALELEKNISCTGFIDKEAFIRLYELSLEVFIKMLGHILTGERAIDYAYFLSDAIYKLEKEKDFIGLEKAINDFLINLLEETRYITFGPEPVIAYYFAKLNEIRIIRMIILTKLNGLPQDIVRQSRGAVYA
jgi:V/A-type H+-transporting ATPase subunit C